MRIGIEEFENWHPQYLMVSESNSNWGKRLYFKPNFIEDTLVYVVTIRDYRPSGMLSKLEVEFTDLKRAIKYYNAVGENND